MFLVIKIEQEKKQENKRIADEKDDTLAIDPVR